MIKLEITGDNFTEINEQLLDIVKGIGAGQTTVNVEPQPLPDFTPTTTRTATDVVNIEQDNFSDIKQDDPSHDIREEMTKRRRRSRAEMEAEKASKLAAAQAEVKQAEAKPEIVIPPMPTTNIVNEIPNDTPVHTQPIVQQPVVAPPQQPQVPAYNLTTFKSNLVMIINNLLITGKVTSEWIGETSKGVFNGQDIWLWTSNEIKIEELFHSFVTWGFIQKFEG